MTARHPAGPLPQLQATLTQAVALHQRGQLAEAAKLYRDVLARAPNQFDALHLLGVLEAQCNHPVAAAELIGRAVRVQPNDVGALVNHGNALRGIARPAEALARYERAIALRPNHVDALYNRGVVLFELRRHDEALRAYDSALAIAPTHVEALYGRGNVLRRLGRPAEALATYDQVLALAPRRVDVWVNRGVALQELQRHREALDVYVRAQALDPTYAPAQLNEGICRLLLGDFADGWPKYSWRWRMPGIEAVRRDFPAPRWQGEDVTGKTVLLHAEPGFGDALQFCRYAELVARRGATVILEVQPAMVALLTGLRGTARVIARGEALPAFDYFCSLLDAPAVFGTDLAHPPANVPYVKADPALAGRWAARLGARRGPRVGIAWSGSQTLDNDQRAVQLADLGPLAGAGIQLVSLQRDVPETDRRALRERGDILDLGGELSDFADTAAVVDQLDLVISIDTAVAHLAGAMAKPVWILIPHLPTWRWLLEREDSPWYPTARLFRQHAIGDWNGVIARVQAELMRTFNAA